MEENGWFNLVVYLTKPFTYMTVVDIVVIMTPLVEQMKQTYMVSVTIIRIKKPKIFELASQTYNTADHQNQITYK